MKIKNKISQLLLLLISLGLLTACAKQKEEIAVETAKARKAAAKKVITTWINDLPEKALSKIRLDEQLN